MSHDYQQAYLEILRLRFGEANRIIDAQKSHNPDNLAYCYLETYEAFLKALISEEQQDYATFLKKKSANLKLLNTVSKNSPWYLYAQAQINLQHGIAAVKAKDYMQAVVNIKKAYSQFEENKRIFPHFKPNHAGIGLLYVLVGSVPESVKWVPGLLGMKGNISHGMQLLHETLTYNPPENEWPYLFNECAFITTFITFNLAGTEENIAVLQNILEDQRLKSELAINPLLIYAVSSFYSYQGRNDKALELLIHRPKGDSYYNFRYLDYLTGVAYLNKLDHTARVYFLKYVTQFKGKHFIKSAYQHLAWSYLIEYDTVNYKKYLSRVGLFGLAEMENDKEADAEAQKRIIPEPELLKARLLFDGGYYSRARDVLNGITIEKLNNEQKIERLYRMARIYHRQGNIKGAKENYILTYNTRRNSRSYFAAYSLLNLGIINEEEGLFDEAVKYYKLCLNMDFDQYKSSIHQKAKAGINRINTQ